MQTIKGRVEYRRPVDLKPLIRRGEGEPVSDPGLSAGHPYSSKAALLAQRAKLLDDVRRIEGIVSGLDLAIELLSQSRQ
jgi:hypothetical protein